MSETNGVTNKEEVAASNSSEISSLEEKIIQQIEYYFGDINLPRDKFLLEEMKHDDGWIPMETMLKFNRLKSLSSDYEVICAALGKSKTGLIEIGDDHQRIRRSKEFPLPDNSMEYWQKVKDRSVYVKGFPQDATLDELEEFFRKYGQLEGVIMRRVKTDRIFKGSVFATFPTVEECQAVVDDDKSTFKGQELLRLMQNDYWQKKQKERKDDRQAKKDEKLGQKPDPTFTKGLLMSVKNLPEGFDYNELKEFLNQHGSVAFVEAKAGTTQTLVRFRGAEGSASEVMNKAVEAATDGKVIYKEKELELSVVTGEEETKYYKELYEIRNKRNQSNRHQSPKKRRHGGDRKKDRKSDVPEKAPKIEAKKTIFNSSSDEDESEVFKGDEVEKKVEIEKKKATEAVTKEKVTAE